MRGLLFKLARFLPLGMLVPAANYLVDPGSVFRDEAPEVAVAREALQGRSVSVRFFALDEGRMRQALAEGRRRPPDVLVLGSSRAMPLSKAAFPDRDVANGSISSASLEDLIAVGEVYEERGLRPRGLVLAIEPWALSRVGLRSASSALDAQLQRGLRRLGRGAVATYGALPAGLSTRGRWRHLLSPAYFQASVSVLAGGARRGAQEPARRPGAAGGAGESGSLQPDGSWRWAPHLADRTIDEVRVLAATEGRRMPPFLQGEPAPERVALLEDLLRSCRARGIEVVLWLPPFHPAAYEGFAAQERGRALMRAEDELRSLAARTAVSLVGSYDPRRGGAGEADFIDSSHLRYGAADEVFARSAAAAGGRPKIRIRP